MSQVSWVRSLAIVCRAFRLSEAESCWLRPDDEVWALYRHFYPRRSGWRRFFDNAAEPELQECTEENFARWRQMPDAVLLEIK